MRIAGVTVYPLTLTNDVLPERSLSYAMLKVETDEGITGYGEISDSYGCTYAGMMKALIDQTLTRLLIDEDPEQTGRLVRKMRSWTRRRLGDSWVVIQAISGIEIALLDILGKARKKSISDLTDRTRDAVDLYASGPFLEQGSADWIAETLSDPLSKGIKMVKVRMGAKWEDDLKKLAQVRSRLGDGVQVMVDGNENYSLTTALKISKRLSSLGIEIFEEPIPVFNLAGMSQLAAASDVPISYGEHHFCLSGFEELVERHAADVLQPDATISGGIAECLKIGDLAYSRGLSVYPHFACGPIGLAANLQLSACLQTFGRLEYSFLTNTHLSKVFLNEERLSPAHVNDGKLAVPRGPGLGIDVREDALTRFPYVMPKREGEVWPLSQGTI